jgi:spermidine/putrescine transport system permease protein
LRSVGIAGLTTLITLLIGFPVAVWLAMQPAHRRGLLIFLITVPFWANLLIRTYAWILLLRNTGVINNSLMGMGVIHEPLQLLYTDGAVLLGLVYTYAPFVVLPIYATLEKMDSACSKPLRICTPAACAPCAKWCCRSPNREFSPAPSSRSCRAWAR